MTKDSEIYNPLREMHRYDYAEGGWVLKEEERRKNVLFGLFQIVILPFALLVVIWGGFWRKIVPGETADKIGALPVVLIVVGIGQRIVGEMGGDSK